MKKGARTDLATLTMPFSVALSVLNTGVRRLMYLTFRCLGSGQSLASRQILSTNSPGCTGSIVFMKKRHSMPADTGEKICLTLGLLSSPLMASSSFWMEASMSSSASVSSSASAARGGLMSYSVSPYWAPPPGQPCRGNSHVARAALEGPLTSSQSCLNSRIALALMPLANVTQMPSSPTSSAAPTSTFSLLLEFWCGVFHLPEQPPGKQFPVSI